MGNTGDDIAAGNYQNSDERLGGGFIEINVDASKIPPQLKAVEIQIDTKTAEIGKKAGKIPLSIDAIPLYDQMDVVKARISARAAELQKQISSSALLPLAGGDAVSGPAGGMKAVASGAQAATMAVAASGQAAGMAAMKWMILSQTIDDAQYGFKAIVNNIPMVAGAFLGMGSKAAGAIGIAAVAINQLILHMDELRNAIGLTDEFAQKTFGRAGIGKVWGNELDELKSKIGKLRPELDKLNSEEWLDPNAAARKQELEGKLKPLEESASRKEAAKDAISMEKESTTKDAHLFKKAVSEIGGMKFFNAVKAALGGDQKAAEKLIGEAGKGGAASRTEIEMALKQAGGPENEQMLNTMRKISPEAEADKERLREATRANQVGMQRIHKAEKEARENPVERARAKFGLMQGDAESLVGLEAQKKRNEAQMQLLNAEIALRPQRPSAFASFDQVMQHTQQIAFEGGDPLKAQLKELKEVNLNLLKMLTALKKNDAEVFD